MERRTVHYSALIGAGVFAVLSTFSALSALSVDEARAAPNPPSAGDRMVQALRANTVAIRAEWEEDGNRSDGFGFITAVEGEYTYVATANHVVRGYEGDNEADKVTVRFFGSRKPVLAQVLDVHDATLDVGVIKIKGRPKRPWFRSASGERAAAGRGTEVWFIGRSGTWYTPARPGTINYLDPDLGLVLEGLSVIVGTSGAPLISQDGIIGLMTTDAAGDLSRACPVKEVRKQLRSWKVPWQLVPPDLKDVPPGTEISAEAIADSARLAARMSNFERAGEAARRAFEKNPKNVDAAELLLSAAVQGPWRLCGTNTPNSCPTENPYYQLGYRALKGVKKDAERAGRASVRVAEARLLRMRGELEKARQVAEKGLKAYPESPGLLAEVGMARAQAGDAEGPTLIARARREAPDESLYIVYQLFALLDVEKPIEAAQLLPAPTEMIQFYQADQKLYQQLVQIFAVQYPKRLWSELLALIPKIEADNEGTRFAYGELAAAIEKHKNTAGYNPPLDRLRASVALRQGKTDDAVAAARSYVRKQGELSNLLTAAKDPLPKKRQAALDSLRFYHGLLVAADVDPKARYAIERYSGLELPFSVSHRAWPADEQIAFEDGYAGEISSVVLAEPPTSVLTAVGNGVRRWRVPELTPTSFVVTDAPVCGLAASKDGMTVAFVTDEGRGYVWRDGAKAFLRPLEGAARLSCRVAVAPDGARIAAVKKSRHVVSWAVKAPKKKPRRGSRLAWIPDAMSFTPDGRSLLIGARSTNAFAVVALGKKAPPRSFKCGPGDKSIGVGLDGASMQVATADGENMYVCAAPTGKVILQDKQRSRDDEFFFDFYDQGRRLAMRKGRSSAKGFLLSEEKARGEHLFRNSGLMFYDVSDDAEIAVGLRSRRSALMLVKKPRGEKGKEWRVERSANKADRWGRVAVDPSLRYLAVLSKHGSETDGFIYDLEKRQPVCSSRKIAARRYVPVLSAEASLLTMTTDERYGSLVYDRTCSRVANVRTHGASPSGRWIAQRDGSDLVIEKVGDETQKKTFACGLSNFHVAEFSPDEQWVVATDQNVVCFVDLKAGTVDIQTYKAKVPYHGNRELSRVRSAAFTPDSSAVLLVDESGAISRWTLPAKKRKTFAGPLFHQRSHWRGLPRLAVEPSGRSALTLSGQTDLMRWDLKAERTTRTAALTDDAFHLAVSTDGKRVLVGSHLDKLNAVVRIFDRAQLAPLATVRAFGEGRWLVYRPDGRCWAPDDADEGLIPEFVVTHGKVRKTGRKCDDGTVRALLGR